MFEPGELKKKVRVGLRFKFSIYVTLLVFALVVIMTIATVAIERDLMIAGMEDRARTLTSLLIMGSTDAIIKSDIIVLRKFVGETLSNEHGNVLDIHIFDEDGKCLASSDQAREGAVATEAIVRKVLSADSSPLLKNESRGYIDFAMRLSKARSLYVFRFPSSIAK